MEFVEVRFSQKRDVIINEEISGETNKILRIGAGTQTFTLEGRKDFSPGEITQKIKDTSSLKPAVIEFKEVAE